MIEELRSFGVATGEFARLIFAKHGVLTIGFVWDYRPRRLRDTFPPHRALHGEKVSGIDDPKLINQESWPRVSSYYPGDHGGCKCRLRPRMVRQ